MLVLLLLCFAIIPAQLWHARTERTIRGIGMKCTVVGSSVYACEAPFINNIGYVMTILYSSIANFNIDFHNYGFYKERLE